MLIQLPTTTKLTAIYVKAQTSMAMFSLSWPAVLSTVALSLTTWRAQLKVMVSYWKE
jgi:hypothetical protein